ncbi:MAG: DUF1460 domain-containing protein [Deltaproteobacteria bacterium]|nr:DUF1460 domain-containing protein [Deltaproteobacteria bacterium]
MLPLLATLLAATPAWQPPSDTALDALVRELQARPLTERLDALSTRFLGAPYQMGLLGEGPGNGPDPDPLWRWDAVDCVTFVEEMLALARASSLADAEQVLQRIRYGGNAIRFAERNHLMESQWLPNNIRKGFVRLVTKDIAGTDVRYLWRRALLPDRVSDVALPYLPLDRALAHQDQIPEGAIFFVARGFRGHVADHVTHVGFFVRHGGRLFARHASSGRRKVVDEPFEHFLLREAQSIPRFPVVGLELALPVEPGAP